MLLYPLKLKPVYKVKPWGGKKLNTYFGRKIPLSNIGESWELCCRKEGMSLVENGKYRGSTLQELMETFPEKLLGVKIYRKYGREFPLLFKILDARERLSVQVHPDDACARAAGLAQGKDELWYIIKADKNASLIYGLKRGTSKAKLEKAIRENRICQLLNEVEVKPGDFFYIPAGTVHALLGGIMAAEIQQNCNTTYRIYDWNRVDQAGRKRELHIRQALKAIHFAGKQPLSRKAPDREQKNGALIRRGPRVKEFQTDEIRVNGVFTLQIHPDSFQVILNLHGDGKILYEGGSIDLKPGDTLLLPAETGRCRLYGNMLTLFTHLPVAS